MKTRMVAVLRGSRDPLKVVHYSGMPPELTSEKDSRQRLPHPRVVFIESKEDGVFLTRYGEGGVFAGDTWHQSIEDAKQQAVYEYGDILGPWHEVPPGITDPFTFSLNLK